MTVTVTGILLIVNGLRRAEKEAKITCQPHRTSFVEGVNIGYKYTCHDRFLPDFQDDVKAHLLPHFSEEVTNIPRLLSVRQRCAC